MNNYAAQLAALKAQPCHKLKEIGDQWRTPDWLYWGIFAAFGPFILDLFSDGTNSKCQKFFTVEDNALAQDWTSALNGGKAFFNPPYSRSSYDDDGTAITGMRNIIAKAMAERDKGARMVCLIKAATSEVWWTECADHVAFIRGRISFDLPEWYVPADKKQVAASAGFACAIAVFDKSWQGKPMSYIKRDQLMADGETMMRLMNNDAA